MKGLKGLQWKGKNLKKQGLCPLTKILIDQCEKVIVLVVEVFLLLSLL